jgi:hypothetical protein
MKFLKQSLMLTVSLVVLNVWLIRWDKASSFGTSYRGGDAANLFEELQAYGLNSTLFCLIGLLKISTAIFLLMGFRYEKTIIPAAGFMAAFMVGALFMHFKVGDEAVKYLPSAFMLFSSLTIILLQRRADGLPRRTKA